MTRPEFVPEEVVEAAGHDLDWYTILFHSPKCHERDAGLERQKLGPIVRTSLREDANAFG